LAPPIQASVHKGIILHKSTLSSRWERIIASLGFARRQKNKTVAPPRHQRLLGVETLEERTLLSVCVWDGGGGPLHNNWNNADNWVLQGQPSQHVAPVAGDSLRFEGTGTVAQNDFPAGTSFSSITFADGGFQLTGNSLCLSGGIAAESAATTSTISLNLALHVVLPIEVAGNAALSISGVLSGESYPQKIRRRHIDPFRR
jgi:hypothetical protein